LAFTGVKAPETASLSILQPDTSNPATIAAQHNKATRTVPAHATGGLDKDKRNTVIAHDCPAFIFD